MCGILRRRRSAFGSRNTGAAWLSSARVVRCWLVPQRAQPLSLVAIIRLGTLMRLPVTSRRKVGMTSSPHGPYDQGFTRHTMVGTEGSQAARRSQSHKTDRSPDCTLQLECMKSESLVIAGQHTAVNTFPGLYTPPVTPWEWGIPEVGRVTARSPLTTVCFMTGVKS